MEKLEQLEYRTFVEDDSTEVPPSDIIAYNELRSCADLFRMHQQGILDIQPEFQREFVWKGTDQTRFIDSLVKQLPIPSMCFALDHRTQRWIVIDGLQRISTIVRFLMGGDWTLSDLDDIDPEIAGKSVAAIKTSEGPLNRYYRRVENLSIPITVLRCDFSKQTHMDFLFTIFHRLNTGGTKLNNQEIRNCIFGGPFNNLLKVLDTNLDWRRLNKMSSNDSYRFVKQEILLRFFSFHDRLDEYEGHLAGFLNEYMHSHRNETSNFLEAKANLFRRTVACISTQLFSGKSQPKMTVTLLESLLVAVARNIDLLEGESAQSIQDRYNRLISHPEFSDGSLREGLSKKLRVRSRILAAVAIFS